MIDGWKCVRLMVWLLTKISSLLPVRKKKVWIPRQQAWKLDLLLIFEKVCVMQKCKETHSRREALAFPRGSARVRLPWLHPTSAHTWITKGHFPASPCTKSASRVSSLAWVSATRSMRALFTADLFPPRATLLRLLSIFSIVKPAKMNMAILPSSVRSFWGFQNGPHCTTRRCTEARGSALMSNLGHRLTPSSWGKNHSHSTPSEACAFENILREKFQQSPGRLQVCWSLLRFP